MSPHLITLVKNNYYFKQENEKKKTLRVNFNDQLTILCIDCHDVNQNSHYTNLASTRKKV